MKILLVEDEAGIANYIRHLLAPHSDVVHVCHSLVETHALLHNERYDAIIVDLKLTDAAPSLTVGELPKIRAMQPDAALIVQTGSGETYRNSCMEAGADMFIAKTPENLERGAFYAAIAAALLKKGKRSLSDSLEILKKVAES